MFGFEKFYDFYLSLIAVFKKSPHNRRLSPSSYTSTDEGKKNKYILHKRNNKKQSTNNTKHSKYKYTYYQNTHTIVKTPQHTLTHTLKNKLKQPQYKIHTK